MTEVQSSCVVQRQKSFPTVGYFTRNCYHLHSNI